METHYLPFFRYDPETFAEYRIAAEETLAKLWKRSRETERRPTWEYDMHHGNRGGGTPLPEDVKDARVAAVHELLLTGKTVPQCAEILGLSVSQVKRACHEMGGARNMRMQNEAVAERRQRVRELIAQGLSITATAKAMGLTPHQVTHDVQVMGGVVQIRGAK